MEWRTTDACANSLRPSRCLSTLSYFIAKSLIVDQLRAIGLRAKRDGLLRKACRRTSNPCGLPDGQGGDDRSLRLSDVIAGGRVLLHGALFLVGQSCRCCDGEQGKRGRTCRGLSGRTYIVRLSRHDEPLRTGRLIWPDADCCSRRRPTSCPSVVPVRTAQTRDSTLPRE